MSNKRVLVVGTTADYIDIINRRFPQRAIFITDANERARAAEPSPGPKDELLCDLSRPERIVTALQKHLKQWQIDPGGITCFDCESMSAASFIARSFGLAYPSAEAVAACRSKYICKQLWRQARLPCPNVELVHTASNAVSFMKKTNGPVVLKPLTGSGSELIFMCSTEDECVLAFNTMRSELARHAGKRMYAPYVCDGKRIDPCTVFVIEEFIQGDEYSCDFAIDGDRVEIIRIAKKILDPKQPCGTTVAYLLPGILPESLTQENLRSQLRTAAKVLGLDRAICMLDFVVRGDKAVMIELAPRPGGDCLPPLLLKSCGMNILGRTLDFAEGQSFISGKSLQYRPLVGLRLLAACSGEIEYVDSSDLIDDHRIVEFQLKRTPGHRVILPPKDYESRLLGHVIFEPAGFESIENECIEIASKLKVEMKRQLCTTASPS
ncbi:MAG: ATP-grasp domain-containing protein [Sedimentisphaerales bacterium]|nr:ATP-grasp domain-containing protein [Sedimentisphaerales bacterium]